jgi:hypothetical protein
MKRSILLHSLVAALAMVQARAETVAFWPFDEQEGLYPSSILNDAGPQNWFLVLGRGGEMVPGKFGRAVRAVEPRPFNPSYHGRASQEEFTGAGEFAYGLSTPPMKPGRTVEPMTWFNATFAAAFVNGDEHLRRLPFPSPTKGDLNLGRGDFTIEFWLKLDADATGEGVVLEVGSGPRGENDQVTRVSIDPAKEEFLLFNQCSGSAVHLKTDVAELRRHWVHCAITYDAGRGELKHFLNGRLHAVSAAKLAALREGPEDYFSVGRDGTWGRPLNGGLDELRISSHVVYRDSFPVPGSFSRNHGGTNAPLVLQKGPPLQFPGGKPANEVVALGGHKHLFIDDALIARSENVVFTAHPARIEEIVLPSGTGWSTVIEDEDGLIRLYGEGNEGVAVWTSRDGVHFETPDLGGGRGNTVAESPAKRGAVFIDPNAPPGERWKMLVGLHERGGLFIYS